MLYLLASYWPFLLAALLAGVIVGWWFQDPHRADEMTAWLERGRDEP
jgi:hypothetical protein